MVVSGSGCQAGAAVQFIIEGQPAGTTVADGTGAFSGRARIPFLSVGAHEMVAQCGGLTLRTPLPVVLATAIASAP
ncbi:MAG: hypothetical protein ACR2LJ_07590 [Acidimicrobiales bacterium]